MKSFSRFAPNSFVRVVNGARFFSQGGGDDKVSIASWRLEQLIESEITHLSLRDPVPLTLNQIIGMKDYRLVGEKLGEELPVRYAHRIKLLETIPNWKRKKGIAEVHANYIQSFNDLRIADPAEDRPGFIEVCKRIQQRHANTRKLVVASRHLELNEKETNALLDKFFMSRISTNLLISQYLHLVESEANSSASSSSSSRDTLSVSDVVSPRCDPAEVAHRVVADVEQRCLNLYGKAPLIRIRDKCALLPFPPRYLHFVLLEILKNSAKATLEEAAKTGADLESKLIDVVISRDEYRVAIRISDEGGGIRRNELDHIWSYQFTSSNDAPYTDNVDEPLMKPKSSCSDNTLSGGGFGLPMAKLYVNYLGGEINLNSIPMHGTDVYIFLSPEGNKEEQVPGSLDMLSSKDISAYEESCGILPKKAEPRRVKPSWRDTLQPKPIPAPFIGRKNGRQRCHTYGA